MRPWLSRTGHARHSSSAAIAAEFPWESRLAQEAGFQHEALDPVRVAFDVLRIVYHQADVADDGALLERDRAALHLEVLDHHHRVSALPPATRRAADFQLRIVGRVDRRSSDIGFSELRYVAALGAWGTYDQSRQYSNSSITRDS